MQTVLVRFFKAQSGNVLAFSVRFKKLKNKPENRTQQIWISIITPSLPEK